MRIATTALLRLYTSSSYSQTFLSLLFLDFLFQNLGGTTNFSHRQPPLPPLLLRDNNKPSNRRK